MNPIGKRLKELRINSSKTQEEICDILNVSQSSLANYETDRRYPSLDVIVEMSKLYNVPIDFIIGTGVFANWEQLLQNKESVIKAVSTAASRLSIDMLNGIDDLAYARLTYAFNVSVKENGDSITIIDPFPTISSSAFPDVIPTDHYAKMLLSVYKDLSEEDKMRTFSFACDRRDASVAAESELKPAK